MREDIDVASDSYAEYIKNFYEQKEIIAYFDDYYSKLSFLRGMIILDNGCGIGSSSKRLLAANNRVISLEYNPFLLKYACKKGAVKEPIRGDSQNLPIKSNCVNVVIFHDVIEHLHLPGQALKEIHRILKSNGKLYLITPNGLWSSLCYRLFPNTKPDDPTHIHEFNWKELKAELLKSGFRIANASASSLPLVNKISTKLSRKVAQVLKRSAIYIACPAFWVTAEKLERE